MNNPTNLERKYLPLSEPSFYILYFLQEEDHGYGISQKTRELTQGEVIIGPGTMYGSLSKMEKDGLIRYVRQEGKRKLYTLTPAGLAILEKETKRIERLYHNSKGEKAC